MLSEEVMDEFRLGRIVFRATSKEMLKVIYDNISLYFRGDRLDLVSMWDKYGDKLMIFCSGPGILKIHGDIVDPLDYADKFPFEIITPTAEYFSSPSEAQQDLEILHSLFKKYQVCIAEHLEETIEKAAKKEIGDI